MRQPYLNARLQGFGTTIFAEMSALAVATGAINLGQGFPDTDGPSEVLDAAIEGIRGGRNQYPPGPGFPELRKAIADHQARFYGLEFDPDSEVLVTAGATEGIAAAMLAILETGDEVVAFEPFYDCYAASVTTAGGILRAVTLHAPDFRPDPEALRRAIGPRTRIILLNTPHNPTGAVFRKDELEEIARVAVEHDLIVVSDEVYEHLTFDGAVHHPIASFPGMRERTITLSSGGKTFSTTGWKVGWAISSPPLIAAVRTAKQFLTFVNAAPFQAAIAVGLGLPGAYYSGFAKELEAKRNRLVAGLCQIGLTAFNPRGTYFVLADIQSLGERDGMKFCRELPHRCGVVAVPCEVFYANREIGRSLIRFAFCKRDEVLDEAVERLKRL